MNSFKKDRLSQSSSRREPMRTQQNVPEARGKRSSVPQAQGFYFGFDSKAPPARNNKSISTSNPFASFLSKIKLPAFMQGKKTLSYVGIVCLVILILVLGGAYGILASSSIYTATIKYKFMNVSNSKVIDATSEGTGEFATLKLSDTDAITSYAQTTGQKVLGDKSNGILSAFNATTEIKVIPKGTTVTCTTGACNGLTYATQSDSNIGPLSSVNDLRVTATDIGTNYNAQAGAKFKVGTYSTSDIVASNVQAFTGGTVKQTIKIVSEDDIKQLETKSAEDIKAILLNKIRNDPNNLDKYIISDSSLVLEKVSVESDEVGKETDTINLTYRGKATVDAFDKSQIQNVVTELKKTIAPDGYFVDEKYVNSSNEVVGTSPGKISVKVQLNATVRPNLDVEKLKKDLSGKSLDEAEKILSEIPNISGHSYTYSPNMMPELLRRVPSDQSKIIVRMNAEAS